MSWPLILQFLFCPIVFFSLLWITAPYGRHHSGGWGLTLPNRLAWFLMELPALLTIALVAAPQLGGEHALPWFCLMLWLAHYGYRTLLFPAMMRPSSRSFPLLLVLFAIAFNLLNGYNNGEALVALDHRGTGLMDWQVLLGLAVFLAGFLMHVHSDHVIRQLRQPGETGYRIPQGGMFRYVGSPHYLGEIIQWCGWALMTWSLAGVAFALFTFCNLAPRALANHRWYRERFPEYPAKRRILLPWLF